MSHGKYKVSPPDERRALGRTFGSKAEMKYALALEEMVKKELIVDYICQPKVWLGVPEYTYTPDFLVVPNQADDKQAYYVDVKGVETQSFKRHKKMWAQHGRLKLIIVKCSGKDSFKQTEVIG